MSGCHICPCLCGVERADQAGACGVMGVLSPLIARSALHFYEEPMLSGTRGSGTVFFSGCNMRCLFCQNQDISMAQKGEPCSSEKLCTLFLALQSQGAHNINLVTPTPHTEAICAALTQAKARGLAIPIVYNTNGYERAETLRALAGLVDIYLPDLKYVSPALSERLSGRADYFRHAAPALLEMQRQVGSLRCNADGIAQSGLIVRHLVLPGCVDDTCRVLDFIADALPADTWVSLMRQYTPTGDLSHLPAPLRRPLTAREYRRAVAHCEQLGLKNVLVQGAAAADLAFTPPFSDRLSW